MRISRIRVSGMTTFTIDLPYRTPPLTLNGGVPTSVPAMRAKARQIRSVRADAATLARHTNLPLKVAHATIQLHYAPSQTRYRDPINLTPTQKALVDGLRDYGLVEDDDSRYVTDLMPVIHPKTGTGVGRLWLTITTQEKP